MLLHDELLKSYKSQGRTSCCQRDRRPRQLTSASGMRFSDAAMTTVPDSRSHFSRKVLCISLPFMLCLQAFCSSKTLVNEPYFVIIFVVFKSFLGKINEWIMDNCAENMWMKLSRSFCPAGNHPSWRRSCRVAIHARQHHRLFHDPTLALRQSFHQTLQRVLRF